KAKEIWFRNPRLSAREALELGMINQIVPDDQLKQATRDMALEIAERGAFALAAIKTAFSARHGGVGGLARLAHDLLLRQYLDSEESHELGAALNAAGVKRGEGAAGWRPNRVEPYAVLLDCSRQRYVCNPSLHRNSAVAEVVELLTRTRATALFAQPGYGADAHRADIFAAVS